MKTGIKALTFILLANIILAPAVGQEDYEYPIKPFQITLFPPIGSNGPGHQDCVNRISLNILWGESAGLKGIELGGLVNFERDFTEGIQLAGFGNFNRGPMTGLTVSGFINVSHRVNGGSLAGFLTLTKQVHGMQGAGFMNISGRVTGAQVSGFMNIAEELKGAQLSQFMNTATDVTGIQAAGFMNIADEVKGAQTAGFMNIADEVTGAQVAGFLNTASTVKGTQVGFINIADDYEDGVPIGFINIVKNGYHDFEVSTSETWNLSLGYRLGVDHLYTQFFLGSHFADQDDFWGAGFGLGTRFRITGYLKGSVDLLSWQLIDRGKLYSERPNLLEQARFTIEGRIFRLCSWFIGPTLNLLVIPFEYPEPGYLTHIDPWTIYQSTSGISYVRLWPGLQGGIRF